MSTLTSLADQLSAVPAGLGSGGALDTIKNLLNDFGQLAKLAGIAGATALFVYKVFVARAALAAIVSAGLAALLIYWFVNHGEEQSSNVQKDLGLVVQHPAGQAIGADVDLSGGVLTLTT